MKLPNKVNIIEVGPRDGFQNVADFIKTEDKIKIIELIQQAGITAAEVTSFVHPKAIPQMADAGTVAAAITKSRPGLRAIALVPNQRGANHAQAAGINEVSYVISASEAHNQANVKRTIDESIDELERIRANLPEMRVRLDIATAFGCPYAGPVPPERVWHLIDAAVRLEIKEIVLCDTIGIGNPRQVSELAGQAQERYPGLDFTMHLHNTRGQGLANILAALEQGILSFETSVGGLGGCPFAPGAAGNVATEDLLNMLDYMGIETGVDQDALLKAVAYTAEIVHAELTGNMLKACKYEFQD